MRNAWFGIKYYIIFLAIKNYIINIQIANFFRSEAKNLSVFL